MHLYLPFKISWIPVMRSTYPLCCDAYIARPRAVGKEGPGLEVAGGT